MSASPSSQPRVSVDGKFFRLGGKKFHVKGIAYGPFAPNGDGEYFAPPEQTRRDLAQIRDLGANVLRLYHVPPRWFLELAAAHELKLFVDIPWNKHLCFLDSATHRVQARKAVCDAVTACARHPAIFAWSVGNEIAPDIVRWSGAEAVAAFIDELIAVAKAADPDSLCTFTNYPPTEFLRPRSLDFVCFNVYLHHRVPFENYMARLQTLAHARPLLLGEFGMDSFREGEDQKCAMLSWQIESAFRCGLAGVVIFSFTDDWFKDGRRVEDWTMGLTASDRAPKPSFAVVREQFKRAPYFPLPRYPKVSVVVASYNGDHTLKACLDSLECLNYPNFEVILVDDGSTDSTRQRVNQHPRVRYVRHETNAGLSVARNTGIAAATGEIVAFTDADCRADEDWLHHLVSDLLNGDHAGIGGHNLLPPEDSHVAAAVMASPGGPTHVLLTDRRAEHIPGCNMAFYKPALEAIGGFDPLFKRAGDDVDVCWRLQQRNARIGFSPAGFVWHYRRSTVGAFLKQQSGYGEAEAMLVRKHPEYFNLFGGSRWRGRIYSPAQSGVKLRRAIIYHGPFGTSWFQTLYGAVPATAVMFCTTIEFHLLITLPLAVLSLSFRQLLPLAITSLLVSFGVCVAAAAQADLPRAKTRFWSRPLIVLLYFLQPIVRGWARYRGRLTLRATPAATQPSLDSIALRDSRLSLDEAQYWAEQRVDRLAFVRAVLQRLDQQGWPNKPDVGWSEFDVEIYGNRWSGLQVTTVSEDHTGNRQMLRCRLRRFWSLSAEVLFWSVFGMELLVIGIFGHRLSWLWLLLLTLPVLAWFLAREQRDLQSLILVLLDDVAKQFKLSKVPLDTLPQRPSRWAWARRLMTK